MVDSRDKGMRAELTARDLLRKHTKLAWERIPSSGALDEKHGLKGDLYVPKEKNRFCVEVKHYKDDHLTSKILTSKDSQFLKWWVQAEEQAHKVQMDPLLLFKFDRSKWFVAFTTHAFENNEHYTQNYRYFVLTINNKTHPVFIALLEDWLTEDKPEFILHG